MLQQIAERVIAPEQLTWQQRVRGLIRHLAGLESDRTWFSSDMMRLEPVIADARHQQRAYEELLGIWHRMLTACHDLSPRPSADTVEALHLAIWGGRRYALQVGLDQIRMESWAEEMEHLCIRAMTPDP
jgi:hypothetical protein